MLHLPRHRTLAFDRPIIVGVLNVTPDSFSDGGRFNQRDAAITHARQMIAEGADIIDIGGESTRPGAARIPAAEQLTRILPVIEALREIDEIILSVDTTRLAVAEAAVEAGADLINDVSGGSDDPAMFAFLAERQLPCILMHMQGQPATMQQHPEYTDVVAEVRDYLLGAAERAIAAGLPRGQIILDPGIGFGKTTTHNLTIIAQLDQLVATGYPIMLATSRKRFIGEICQADDPLDRVGGTVATTVAGVLAGARLFRVHEVKMNRQAAAMAFALRGMRE